LIGLPFFVLIASSLGVVGSSSSKETSEESFDVVSSDVLSSVEADELASYGVYNQQNSSSQSKC